MESFKSEPQFSPFSPRKPSLFLFFARSCSITLYRTQPIKIELLSYYLTIMVRYRNLVRQIGPSESTVQLLQVFPPLCIEFPRAALDLSTPASFPAGFSSMSFLTLTSIWRKWSMESLTSDSKYEIGIRILYIFTTCEQWYQLLAKNTNHKTLTNSYQICLQDHQNRLQLPPQQCL